MDNKFRYLPSIKAIQDSSQYRLFLSRGISGKYLTMLAREAVNEVREQLMKRTTGTSEKEIYREVYQKFTSKASLLIKTPLRKVINGTGVILHTNLGRARLSERAAEEVFSAATNYTNLELDLKTGERGSRHDHTEWLLRKLTGAEAALVVNNNAAAVYFILRAFAKNKEVIVSRGELVEIGGSFRVSSIMEESDAKLVEVGTTNKTHTEDIEQAITNDTAMVLKVHRSNFNITGFTSSVSRKSLASIAKRHGIIFYEDLGSGAFFDFHQYGIGNEPVAANVLKDGPDIISCSGDKLFGGPQAGIILGKKALIDRLKKHQLMRTFRVDKMTLAALSATIQSYFLDEHSYDQNPTLNRIMEKRSSVKKRAQRLLEHLEGVSGLTVRLVSLRSPIGGGTMPDVDLESYGVAIKHRKLAAHSLACELRKGEPAVIGRIQDEDLIIDCRTVADNECVEILNAVQNISYAYDES
ncbi:L-seryl-tRNA(Ser) seleniumtransferase [Scopulibacillus daqui]|uniref:L-seryl-tRNA(Sec) selenium transferase n=1 Tax=Scopulibacillus daqui TaxID=1469162 RepID=A0ABS2Q130_9BACL|nr:L-seryl-tRNA(Sec) selenium transferase [Scopulibacillus daqui]MBM7645232.1 L-seryl-tRNA(Ser) seleniumtransferase [Scopulibacillus daqui]